MTGRRGLRVLAFAYACEPGRGSEPAAGWGLTRAVADAVDLTVLTGASHAPGLARWRQRHPDAAGTYLPVAEPTWTGRLPTALGNRLGWFARYLAWLDEAARVARALQATDPFDVVWHASYATYWLPSTASEVGPPVLWGPVGGGVTTPRALWPVLGAPGLVGEAADALAVRLGARWPATRRTWRAVDVPVVQNRETLAALPPTLRARATVLNHAVFAERPGTADRRPRRGALLHLSPLERRKGPSLVLRSLATTPPDVTLAFVGEGPLRGRLERLAGRLGVAPRVRFLGRVPHHEISALLAGAPAAVFTGLREEGGIALAEALIAGTPTILLGHGGARTVAAAAVDEDRVVSIPPGPVAETARQIGRAMTRFSRDPPEGDAPLLDVDAARMRLLALLRAAAGQSTGEEDVTAPST